MDQKSMCSTRVTTIVYIIYIYILCIISNGMINHDNQSLVHGTI